MTPFSRRITQIIGHFSLETTISFPRSACECRPRRSSVADIGRPSTATLERLGSIPTQSVGTRTLRILSQRASMTHAETARSIFAPVI
jgi:hypothetical protein